MKKSLISVGAIALAIVFLTFLQFVMVFFLSTSTVLASPDSYNPSGYNLLENTKYVSGAVGNLASNDNSTYMTFRSYPSAFSGDVQVAENEAEVTYSTTTNYQDRVTLTWTPAVADNYLIIATAEIKRTSTPSTTKAQLTIDGTSVAETFVADGSDLTMYRSFVGFKISNLTAASHTIKIQYATTNTSNTATIKNSRIIAMRIGNNFKASEPANSTTTSTNYTDIATLTFTPDITENWLILAHADVTNATTTNFSGVLENIDGENMGETYVRTADNTYFLPAAFQRVVSLSGGTSHTLKVQMKSPSGTTLTYKNVGLYAIPTAAVFKENFWAENRVGGSTTLVAPGTDTTTLSFTPSSAGDYLILATGEIMSSSYAVPGGARLTVGATAYGNSIVDHMGVGHWASFAIHKRLTNLSGAQTAKISFYTQTAGTTMYIRNARIVALRLPPVSTFKENVEFTGTSNTKTWDNLVWTVDSQWSAPSVDVSLQLYNYNLGRYAASGENGYISYTSSSTPNTDATQTQTITTNPTNFRDSNGNWKVNLTGSKSTSTQFDLKVDWVEYATQTSPPGQPTLLSPADNTTPTKTPTFTWNGGANADNHRIEIDNLPDFSIPTEDNVVSPLSDNSYTKPQPGFSGGIYYWRVWALNAAGYAVSATRKFTISGDWYDSNWRHRKMITIDNSKVTSTRLDNFPVLIDITSTDFSDAQANGNDILFTTSDGVTKLNHEIERFADNLLLAWVKIPVLYSSTPVFIYLYYGNASASNQENVTGVWGSQWKTATHMAQSENSAEKDSVTNSLDYTKTGTVTSVDGKIGKARKSTNGDNNYLLKSEIGFPDFRPITIMAWVKFSSLTLTYSRVWSREASGEAGLEWEAGAGTGSSGTENKLRFFVASSLDSVTAFNLDTWYLLATTFVDNLTPARIYINGALDNSGIISDKTCSNPLYLFRSGKGTGRGMDGTIDEFRMYNGELSVGFINTCFNNQNSPSSFYSVGEEENVIVIVDITLSNVPISYGTVNPGTENKPASDNTHGFPMTIKVESTTTVKVDIYLKGTNLSDGAGHSIGVDNCKYDDDNTLGQASETGLPENTLKLSYPGTANSGYFENVTPGSSKNIYFWISIKSGQWAGTYTNNVYIKAVKDGTIP